MILFGILYLFAPWLLIAIFSLLKRSITRYFVGRNKQRISGPAKPTMMGSIKKHVAFTVKEDKRKIATVISIKLLFFLIYLAGLAFCIAMAYFENYIPAAIALVVPYIAVIFSSVTSDSILKKRDTVVDRLLSFKSEKMGLVGNQKQGPVNPSEEFVIRKWEDDYITPSKILMYLPTKFDSLGTEAFMASFNVIFGGTRNWVADKSDPDLPGWDFVEGKAAFSLNPPLPPIAMWDEEYLFNPSIAPSFFPLALGVENGVKITNSKTGKEEFLLGIDFQGDQIKLAKKKQIPIGSEIATSPMCLVAGGTGGGKSLSLETPLVVLRRQSNC